MITIIEGVDCAGKSTLARALLDRAPDSTAILHQRPYEGDVLLDTLQTLSAAVSERPHVICDRLHLGESIYGPVFRGHDKMGSAQQRMIERVLLSLDECIQVICVPPFATVKEIWLARRDEEMLTSIEQLKEGYLLYRSARTMLPTLTWDWTKQSLEWLLNNMADEHSPKNLGPGIGWWDSGSVLIVGEQCSTDQPGPLLPFVGTGGSSVWLADRLDRIDERWLYWVNARTPSGTEEDPEFIERLSPRGIIALGAVAGEWLMRHGFKYERVDHPSYHKRFLHGEPYPLAETIHELRAR